MLSREIKVLVLVAVSVVAIVAIVTAAIVLSGGGESSRDDYEATIVNARDRVDVALARIGQSQSLEELLTRIDEAAELVGRVAGDLSGTKIADGFDDENQKLVRTLRSFSEELAGTAATFRDPAFAASLPGINSLSFEQWTAVNRILVDLEKQGIEVQPLARH